MFVHKKFILLYYYQWGITLDMNWIDRIAFNLNIRGEEPNKILAREIVESNSIDGVKELSHYLLDKNKSVSSDVIATLYHIGYEKPDLIRDLLDRFFTLLDSRINRMVWGSMIAISTLVDLEYKTIYSRLDIILEKTEKGSLITQIHGINILASLSRIDGDYKNILLPILLDYLHECRPIDFPKRVGIILPLISTEDEKLKFNMIVDSKIDSLTPTQKGKVDKLLKQL